MKFRRNEKYDTIAIYAFLTVVASLLICLAVSNLTSLWHTLGKFFEIISPITYGAVIAYLLNPMVRLFENKVFKFKKAKKNRRKLRRVLSIVCTFVIAAALITAFIVLLVPQIASSYEDLSGQISTYLNSALKWADSFVRDSWIFNGKYEKLTDLIDVNELTTDVKALISNSFKILETASNYIIAYAGKFVVEVKNVLIGIIISVYLLWMKEGLAARLKKLLAAIFNRKAYLNIVNLTRYTHESIGSFLVGKILDSLIIGLLTFIVTGILRIPFYPLISLVICVTNIIPVFGPIFGAIPTGFIVLVTEPKKFIVFIIAIIIIQQLDGNFIGPKILGERSGVSAMWIMIAIIIGGGFFGITGMILAVPVFVVIYTILKQFSEKRLKDKGMPSGTDFYEKDPPPTDFSSNHIFIRNNEQVPDELQINKDVEEDVDGKEAVDRKETIDWANKDK